MNPFYVEPANIQPAVDTAMSGFRSYAVDTEAKNKEAKLKTENEQRLNELGTVINEGTAADLGNYLLRYPELANNVNIAMGAEKKLTDDEDNSWAWGVLTGQFDPQKAAIQRAEVIQSRGGDSALTLQVAKDAMAGNPETAKKMATAILAKNMPKQLQEYLEATGQGKTKPPTDLASFVDLAKKKWLLENPGKTEADVPPQVLQDAALNFKRQQAGEAAAVATAKTGAELDTRIKKEPVLKTATTTAQKKVESEYDPIIARATQNAKNASDLAYAQSIKQAESEGAAITADTTEKLKQVNNIRGSISILDEAISQIDNGASTGVITNLLPNIRRSTIELDNTRKRLGLSVIQSATFGALSESEMKFALNSAMPTNLSPSDLRNWLVRKKDAQEKAANAFEKYVIEVGKPGMTRSKALQRMGAPEEKPTPERRTRPKAKESPVSKYKEGQTATVNGRKLVFKNGVWRDM